MSFFADWMTRTGWSRATLAASVCLALAGTVPAAILNVPQDYATIQAAVDAASDGDEIVISTDVSTLYEEVTISGKNLALRGSGTEERAAILRITATNSSLDLERLATRFSVSGTGVEQVLVRNCRGWCTQDLNGGSNSGAGSFSDLGQLTLDGFEMECEGWTNQTATSTNLRIDNVGVVRISASILRGLDGQIAFCYHLDPGPGPGFCLLDGPGYADSAVGFSGCPDVLIEDSSIRSGIQPRYDNFVGGCYIPSSQSTGHCQPVTFNPPPVCAFTVDDNGAAGATTATHVRVRRSAMIGDGMPCVVNSSLGSTIDYDSLIVTMDTDAGAVGSLRQVLAAVADGGGISFDSGLLGKTIALASPLAVNRPVTIAGPGADRLTVKGGAAYRALTISAADVAISGLSFKEGTDAGGGAAEVTGSGGASFTDCLFRENEATGSASGGAIFSTGRLHLERCSFVGNLAGAAGGAVAHASSDDTTTTLRLVNCTFAGNSTKTGGGGIALLSGSGIMAHCTLTGNDCDSTGASLGSGGGIAVAGGALEVSGSIVAENWRGPAEIPDDLSAPGGMLSSSGYNLIGCGDGLPGFGAAGDQVGTLADPIDPLLGNLVSFAGATASRSPVAGSPAVDTGDPAFQPPPSEDQRGSARVISGRIDIGSVEAGDAEIEVTSSSLPIPDGGTLSFGFLDTPTSEVTRVLTIANTGTSTLLLGTPTVPASVIMLGQFPTRIEADQSVDISFKMTYSLAAVSTGLLEFATSDADEDLYRITFTTQGRCGGSLTHVTNTNDSGPGSLRQAIAVLCSGGNIYFDPGLSGAEIVLTSGPLLVERSVNIRGYDPDTGVLPVSPTITSNGSSRLFEISGSAVLVDRLRLKGGATAGTAHLATGENATKGGAIFIGSSAAEGGGTPEVELSYCQIEDNHALGKGGAVAIVDGTLRTRGCAFVGNRAQQGGGAIDVEGASRLESISNTTLSANSIATGQGSAILFEATDLDSSLSFITIMDNWSETEATGALHLASARPFKVGSSIIAGSRLATRRSERGIANADVTGSGPATSLGFNVIGSALPASGFVDGVNSDIVGVDPQLDPLTSIGSRTSYHMPRQTSPAIDHGTTISPPPYDQRGGVRQKVELGAAYRADSGSIERDLRTSASNLTSGTLAAHVETAFAAKLNLQVKDRLGEPVAGVPLQLDLPALSGPSATILSDNPATTDADGLTTISLQANEHFGAYQLTVTSTRPGFAPLSIVLRNTTDPVIGCSDVTVSGLSAQSQAEIEAIMQPTASDPDGGSVSLQWDPPGPYDVGVTQVTLTATDDESETASCTATITIRLAGEVGWQFY